MIYMRNKNTGEHRVSKIGDTWDLAEWELIQADADGWIPHNVYECPLPSDSMCDVKTTCDQKTFYGETAGYAYWGVGSTITHYRPILEPQDEKPQEWNGEGLSPVGTVCECMPTSERVECKVVAHRNGYAVAWVDKDAKPVAPVLRACHFRPIRTDRERWVDEAIEHFCDDDAAETMRRIYDAGLAKMPGE